MGVLQLKGYKYATLAESVVSQNSPSGGAASNFLKLTAQRHGRSISDSTVNSIYNQMARGYLDALTAQYSSQGIVTRDINYREAWDFHSRSFAAHGLPADAWTLNSLFNVMANDAIRERYWIEILSTAGNPAAELAILVKTENFMATASVIGTPEVKAACAELAL